MPLKRVFCDEILYFMLVGSSNLGLYTITLYSIKEASL